MIRLYDSKLSGNCHKVRLMLALLGLDYEAKAVDMRAGEQRSPEFLELNPLGQVPVLTDDGVTLRDSQAILVYLALKHGEDHWFPRDPAGASEVVQWLSYSANEVLHGLAISRAIKVFKRDLDAELANARGRAVLDVLDAHLSRHDWVATGRVTIADVACYPYVAVAPEGGFDLGPYSAINAWLGRIAKLPGFVAMPPA